MMIYHTCMSIQGCINNAKDMKGCITVDGRTLETVKEIRDFMKGELAKGRRVLPMGKCSNFCYQTGCKGHEIPEAWLELKRIGLNNPTEVEYNGKTLEGVTRMSFWNDDNYKVRLADFVERFVPHNTCVKLFKHILHENEKKWCHEYVLLWRGMDWQITEGYSCSDYFKYHPDVEPCPFSEHNVVSITGVGLSGEFADEVSLVVEELQNGQE